MNHGAPYSLPPELPMWEWAEKHLVIPIETSTPWPGAYETRHTPWVRGWFDVIEDPATRFFAIRKGAQVAATQTFMCAMFYWICEDPGAILYVMDSLEQARDTSKLRLQPMINASERVRREIKDGKEEVDNVLYMFQQAFVRFIGASSPGRASSFTHRFLILEEPEKYKDAVGKEGNVIENLMQRVKRMWNHVVLMDCTPSTKMGFIAKYEDLGDKMRYFVPCPHCGARQILTFWRVVYDKELSPIEAGRKAYYPCMRCGKKITDAQKADAVDHGEWHPTQKPKMTGYRSAWLGGLYPKDESATIRAFTEKCVRILHDDGEGSTDYQVFINSDCGEVYEKPPAKSISSNSIWAIKNKLIYPRGTVPTDGPVILVLICDIQAHHVPFAVWAMDAENQWLVDNGAASMPEDIAELHKRIYYRAVMGKLGQYAAGSDTFRPRAAFIDARHRTTEVYNFCATHPWALPIMGQKSTVMQSETIRWRGTDKYPNGKPIIGGRTIKLAYLHPKAFKDELAYAIESTLWENEEQEPPSKVRVWFHDGIDHDFVHQMQGEVLREGKADKFGQVETYWHKIHTNDYFDLSQYAFAVRHLAHNDLLNLGKQENEAPPPDVAKPDEPKPEGMKCDCCGKPMKMVGGQWQCLENKGGCGNAKRVGKIDAERWEKGED